MAHEPRSVGSVSGGVSAGSRPDYIRLVVVVVYDIQKESIGAVSSIGHGVQDADTVTSIHNVLSRESLLRRW